VYGSGIVQGRHDDDRQLGIGAPQVGEGAEAVRARQIQVQQQQVGVRLVLQRVEPGRDAIGLEKLAGGARGAHRTPQSRAEQRMVVDDDDPVGRHYLGLAAWVHGFFIARIAAARYPPFV
jgi:hypothetical protein